MRTVKMLAGCFLTIVVALATTGVCGKEADREYSEVERPFRWGADELEFSFEPSFADGFLVSIFPPQNGKADVFVYKLHLRTGEHVSFHSFTPAQEIKKAELSKQDYEALVAVLESREVHSSSERTMPGLDGSSWIFRRQVGGRRVMLRFWSPGQASPARALAARFLSAAQLDPNVYLNEAPNPESCSHAKP